MCAMDELTMEDLEGRRIWERLGRSWARSRKRPFRVSLLCLSTALWVALLSAVLARLDGLRLMLAALAEALVVVASAGTEGVVASSFTGAVVFDSFLTLVVVVVVLVVRVASPVEGEGEAEGEASVMAMIRKKKELKCEGYVGIE